MKELTILITHVSYQASAGSFIKLLKKSRDYKFYILGCDSIEKGYSSGSMLVDKFYHIDNYNKKNNYIASIKNIIEYEKVDLVISAEEDDLILFRNNKIEQALYENIPAQSVFDLLKDKHLATEEMRKNGISVPNTILDYKHFIQSKSPTFIRRKRISCCSRGISVLDRTDIKKNYDFYSQEYITQEYIHGCMYTVDVFCGKDGTPHLIIPRKELASKDGTTFKCVIEKQEELINICQQIYSMYRIPGISNIQFIIADKPYFIELNPRAAATMIASSMVSVNYLDMYIKHFLYEQNIPSYNQIMSSVQWNSVITRYYEETIFNPEDSKNE